MRGMIAHNLRSRESSDRRAEDDITRPMAIVVHSRNSDGCRAAVHQRTNRVRRPWPPSACLAALRGRRRERSERVSRWKRSIVVAGLEPAEQLEIVWVRTRRVDEWSCAAECVFQYA